MFSRHAVLMLALGILPLGGCLSPVQREVDALTCDRATVSMDPGPPEYTLPPRTAKPRPHVDPKNLLDRLQMSENIPGSEAKKMVWPAADVYKKMSLKEKQAVIAQYYKSQMDVGPDPRPVMGPEGRPLTLADLQKLAREHSPLLRQAASDISAYQGARIQAAVYFNPILGYTSNAVSFTSGNVFGPSLTQTIRTMGKLKLAEAAAKMDVANAELAYRRAETDLMASVRSAYFQVLVSEEGMRANRALMDLTDEVYKVMLLQLSLAGLYAPYEPSQIGVFAGQARMAYIQSRNSYLQAWKNLATAIGLTTMPATKLAGNIGRSLPRLDGDKTLAHILKNHTDALTANNAVLKARLNLRLAEVTAIPDVTLGATILMDDSLPGPPRFVPVFTGSVPLPFFDRNQGGIKQAQGALTRAVEEPHRVQNALTNSWADAYRRLEESRVMLEMYRKQLLPQQVQAFRGTAARHALTGEQEPVPAGGTTGYMTDLITVEQNLVSLIASYLTTLGGYWQAVSDTASLLQIDDVFSMAKDVNSQPEADLAELLTMPCCHPCSSLPQAPGSLTMPMPCGPGWQGSTMMQKRDGTATVWQGSPTMQPRSGNEIRWATMPSVTVPYAEPTEPTDNSQPLLPGPSLEPLQSPDAGHQQPLMLPSAESLDRPESTDAVFPLPMLLPPVSSGDSVKGGTR